MSDEEVRRQTTKPSRRGLIINEDTGISVKLFFTILALLFSGIGALVSVVMWATNVEAKAVTANTRIDRMADRMVRIETSVSLTQQGVARLEGKLGTLPHTEKEK